MSSGSARAPIATTLLLACLAAAAESLVAAQPAPAPSGVQPPAFRTGVDIVIVEATAVDKAGNVARGLGLADFRAEIGGHAREVVGVEFADHENAPAEGTGDRRVAESALPPGRYTVSASVESDDTTTLRRTFRVEGPRP